MQDYASEQHTKEERAMFLDFDELVEHGKTFIDDNPTSNSGMIYQTINNNTDTKVPIIPNSNSFSNYNNSNQGSANYSGRYPFYKSRVPKGCASFLTSKIVGSISILLCVLLLGVGITSFVDIPRQYNTKLFEGFVNLIASIVLIFRIVGAWIMQKKYTETILELEGELYIANGSINFSAIVDKKTTTESGVLKQRFDFLKACNIQLEMENTNLILDKNNLISEIKQLEEEKKKLTSELIHN